MGAKETLRVITAEEAANYVVCPEAWRLKYLALRRKKPSSRMEQGKKLRKEWMERQDLSAKLKAYGKIIYALLVVIVIVDDKIRLTPFPPPFPRSIMLTIFMPYCPCACAASRFLLLIPAPNAHACATSRMAAHSRADSRASRKPTGLFDGRKRNLKSDYC